MTDEEIQVAVKAWRRAPKLQPGEGLEQYLDRKFRTALAAVDTFKKERKWHGKSEG